MLTTTRHFTTHDGIRLAYLDQGGDGQPVIALHGAYGRARSMLRLTEHLGPGYRLIALDQRGHGHSARADDYSREAYVADLAALITHLGLGPDRPPVLVGHSLGGINAYQFAARHPESVAALVVADFPAEYRADLGDDWLAALPARFPSLRALFVALDEVVTYGEPWHFHESVVEFPDGWGFLWRAEDVFATKRQVCGSWWRDWEAGGQPALVVRGGDSDVVTRDQAFAMAARRPGTEVVEIPGGGHDFYLTHPAQFGTAVRGFLDRLH
ncbi:MAG: alpha/beta hydrolase [Streptomycetaceae bacterium]|nr:alpha/beta hydrolase [Streptomycetaceae bacterium]